MDVSTVFQGGKTVIPKKVRELLGVKDGDRICYLQDELGRVYIEKAEIVVGEVKKRYVVTR